MGLELGPVSDAELYMLRSALEFCRAESASGRAARLHPIACTRPEPERSCEPPASPRATGKTCGQQPCEMRLTHGVFT